MFQEALFYIGIDQVFELMGNRRHQLFLLGEETMTQRKQTHLNHEYQSVHRPDFVFDLPVNQKTDHLTIIFQKNVTLQLITLYRDLQVRILNEKTALIFLSIFVFRYEDCDGLSQVKVPDGCLGPVVNLQFFKYMPQMCFYRVDRYLKFGSDLRVGFSL